MRERRETSDINEKPCKRRKVRRRIRRQSTSSLNANILKYVKGKYYFVKSPIMFGKHLY